MNRKHIRDYAEKMAREDYAMAKDAKRVPMDAESVYFIKPSVEYFDNYGRELMLERLGCPGASDAVLVQACALFDREYIATWDALCEY